MTPELDLRQVPEFHRFPKFVALHTFTTPRLRRFKIPDLHTFATPRLRRFKIPDLRTFATPRLRRFKIPDLRTFATPRLRRFKIPGLHEFFVPENSFHELHKSHVFLNSPTVNNKTTTGGSSLLPMSHGRRGIFSYKLKYFICINKNTIWQTML
jgi:hypothetical protein